MKPPLPLSNPELDALVRRVDEDRWLASRFAPAGVRSRLIALYAVHYEIARTHEVVATPGLAAIRLAWWRESLDAVRSGGAAAPAHPALKALAGADDQTVAALASIADAHARADAIAFSDWDSLNAHLDATAGVLIGAAAHSCGVTLDASIQRAAARAWGVAGVLRTPRLRARLGVTVSLQEGAERAQAAHEEARRLARTAPSAAFPAFGYVALTPLYLRALARNAAPPALLARQLRLLAASATGKL